MSMVNNPGLACGLADYNCPDGSIATDPSKICPGSGAFPADQSVQADLFYCIDGSVITWNGTCPGNPVPANNPNSPLQNSLSNLGNTLTKNALPILALVAAVVVLGSISSGGKRR